MFSHIYSLFPKCKRYKHGNLALLSSILKIIAEEITKIWGIRKIYLRNISNPEQSILSIISNYSSNQENKITLQSNKNSLSEKIEKVKQLDERILDNLKDEELENELEQILDHNDNFHQLFVKIDMGFKFTTKRKSKSSSESFNKFIK